MFYSSPQKNTLSKNKSEEESKISMCMCVQGLSTDTLL